MINALPNHKPQPGTALPSMPSSHAGTSTETPPTATTTPAKPMTPPVQMAGTTHHAASTTTSATHSNQVSHSAAPHGKVDNLAQSLSQKIHGGDPSGSSTSVTPPSVPPTHPDKTMDSPPPQFKKKFNPKTLLAALLMGLVIAGGGAGYYLTQRSQDVRQEAASEEVTNTEQDRTATEWGVFNQQWQELMNNPENEWDAYVRYAQTGGARYECDAPIMTVGSETLYGCDLNAYFVIYNAPAYVQPNAISPQDSDLNQVLNKLVTDSGMLQKAQELGMVTLDETNFNSPSKDMFARLEMLRGIRPELESQFVKTYDFEFITIYFHNETEPQIPLEEAKTAAKRKMDVLYERLKAGEITMAQAGAEIKADAITGDDTGVSLAQLDRLYVENAYVEILEKPFAEPVFTDYTLDEEIQSLGEGQMSTVRLCRDQKFTNEQFENDPDAVIAAPYVDSCYIIFKVNKINLGLSGEAAPGSASELNDSIQKEFEAETSINTGNL